MSNSQNHDSSLGKIFRVWKDSPSKSLLLKRKDDCIKWNSILKTSLHERFPLSSTIAELLLPECYLTSIIL